MSAEPSLERQSSRKEPRRRFTREFKRRLVESFNAMQRKYPKALFEPDVDGSFSLREKLASERLDLIVVPDLFEDTRLLKTRIGTVQNAWMCKPGLLDAKTKLRVHDIAEPRLLTQANLSATGVL